MPNSAVWRDDYFSSCRLMQQSTNWDNGVWYKCPVFDENPLLKNEFLFLSGLIFFFFFLFLESDGGEGVEGEGERVHDH